MLVLGSIRCKGRRSKADVLHKYSYDHDVDAFTFGILESKGQLGRKLHHVVR